MTLTRTVLAMMSLDYLSRLLKNCQKMPKSGGANDSEREVKRILRWHFFDTMQNETLKNGANDSEREVKRILRN